MGQEQRPRYQRHSRISLHPKQLLFPAPPNQSALTVDVKHLQLSPESQRMSMMQTPSEGSGGAPFSQEPATAIAACCGQQHQKQHSQQQLATAVEGANAPAPLRSPLRDYIAHLSARQSMNSWSSSSQAGGKTWISRNVAAASDVQHVLVSACEDERCYSNRS